MDRKRMMNNLNWQSVNPAVTTLHFDYMLINLQARHAMVDSLIKERVDGRIKSYD